jgi:alpha-ketoglutarate-dependent taurine dioxygenase
MVVIHNYQEATVNPVPVPEQESVYKLGFCPEQNTRIPLVIKSPSGVVGLHLGLNTFDYIEGMTKEESNNLVKKIKGELFVEKYIYDYWWENDQNILLFDNSITLHRRLLSKGTCGDRIAYRIPFRYESLYGYYEPYFQEKFNKIKKIKDNVL